MLFVALVFNSCKAKSATAMNHANVVDPLTEEASIMVDDFDADRTIQVALLLDTSNSMDGLIEQAKSRLWNIVNTLTTLRHSGEAPQIQIALYEYGNDGLSEEDDYIRKIAPLTQDLDLISEKLFGLRTYGGSEYCGSVISKAHKSLDWDNKESMKLIYIAGNEPFDQGSVHYVEAISDARKKDIYINTIFCGDKREGEETFWKDGADKGEGEYFHIDADKKVIYIATPYDDRITICNTRLNDTYLGYGVDGIRKKQAQSYQDSNASSISEENAVERTISKSKKSAYNNAHWDIVDKVAEDESFLMNAKDENLPKELQGKTLEEKKQIVQQKADDRAAIQKEIGELSIKRQDYINVEMKKRGEGSSDDLGAAIESSILIIAKKNGFSQE